MRLALTLAGVVAFEAWASMAFAWPAAPAEPAARAPAPRRALGKALPPGAIVTKQANLLRRMLGWRHRPSLVVTGENAADLLRGQVGKPIRLSTIFDQPRRVPAKIAVTETLTTFRSAHAPGGPDLLYPPVLGEYLVVRHERPLAFQRQIAGTRIDGREVRFEGASGQAHSGYKTSDSQTVKGTLEAIRGGSLVVRTRSGSVVVPLDNGVKVLVKR